MWSHPLLDGVPSDHAGAVHTPRAWVLPSQPATRATLLASGVSPAMIRTQVHSGQLVVVRQGVYLRAADWPDDPAARHVVRGHGEQAVNPAAVLSHATAAAVWQLPNPGVGRWSDRPVSVTLPAAGHSSRSRAAHHHTGVLPPAQVLRDPDGYPVTSPARTAVDLAGGLALPEALVLCDGAARLACQSLVSGIRRRDYGNPRLVDAARRLLTEAAATVRCARLGEAIALTEPCRESAAESLSAGHIELGRLPRPRYQAEIRTSRGSFFPDCLWEDRMLIGECDGAVKYADAGGYVLEKEREQILRDLGYGFVRWQAREVMTRPDDVIERIARALGL